MTNRQIYLKRNAIIRYLVNQMNYWENENGVIANYIRNYLRLSEEPLNEIIEEINQDIKQTAKLKDLFINTALKLIKTEVERYINYQPKNK